MKNVTQTGKLYLNMILKADEPIEMVERSIHSVKDYVDAMYITLTYKDEPKEAAALTEYLQSLGAVVSYFKWIDDFSAARQFAMDQAPKGVTEFIYWQDADDVLKGGEKLKSVVAEMVKFNQACVLFDYWYSVDLTEQGKVKDIIIQHKRERIIRNDGVIGWKGMLHETPIDLRAENVIKIFRPDCVVIHLTTPDRLEVNLGRNIRILEKQVEVEDHKDPRTLVYLAKGYFDLGSFESKTVEEQDKWYDRALELFGEYLHGKGELGTREFHEGSGWNEERANAWSFVARIHENRGDYDSALIAIQAAIDECPQFPNFLIDKAAIYINKKEPKKAKIWLTLATSLDMPDSTIIEAPRDMKMRALEIDANIAIAENDLPRARQDYAMMLEVSPTNEILRNRHKQAVELEETNKAAQSVVYLGKYLEKTGEEDKIIPLLKSVPQSLHQERFYSEMRHRFIPPRTHQDNEITILCGPGFEQWSPNSVAKGLGGSEEAVVYLSRALARLGWKVSVYANPEHETGEHDGVWYHPYYDLNISDNFNVFILWRAIGFSDFKPNAKYTMVWMHDVPNNPDFTTERVGRVNKIAVLSEFHKTLFRMQQKDGTFTKIPESKFFMTRNGIPDLSQFTPEKWKGDPKRIVYVSSPDRGLIYLLKHWDRIKKEVPEAELHIYYGFDIYDALFKDNPGKQKWKQMVLSLMDKPGIVYYGRVGHEKLHEAINGAGIWAYPTDFDEISCISGMKAQALGAVPVVTKHAALEETVKNGIKVDVPIIDEEGQEEYVQALIGLLKDPKRQEEIRPHMMKWAQEYYQWGQVATQWDALFKAARSTPEEFLKTLKKRVVE